MARVWLVVDVENIVHRSHHVMPPMISHDRPTGAICGFFRTVLPLRERFGATGCVFAFDSKTSLRKQILPAYKGVRLPPPPAVVWQIKELREKILPRMGFSNVLGQKGYEADDVIAAVAYARCRSAVIVSSDKDLLQCLRPGVSLYDVGMKCVWTVETFHDKYGVTPAEWARVKAMMGDASDNVKGVGRVGLETALKIVKGEKPRGIDVAKVLEESGGVLERNLKLMSLPLEGVDVPELVEDEDDGVRIAQVLESYGIRQGRAVARG